jgi:hypothetical protein
MAGILRRECPMERPEPQMPTQGRPPDVVRLRSESDCFSRDPPTLYDRPISLKLSHSAMDSFLSCGGGKVRDHPLVPLSRPLPPPLSSTEASSPICHPEPCVFTLTEASERSRNRPLS